MRIETKYSDTYATFWFSFLGYDIVDTKKNRTLSKGMFHNVFPEICEAVVNGAELPSRFLLIAREPFRPIVERNGKRIEKLIS